MRTVMSRYAAHLEQSRKPQEGFWLRLLKRTSLRAKALANQPVEFVISTALGSAPGLSDQDVEDVTNYISKNVLKSSGYVPPRLPSDKEVALLKSHVYKDFKSFLAQDPQAKTAFIQHYQDQHGTVPIEVHAMLPRPPAKPAEWLSKVARLNHFSGLARRNAERKPVPVALRQRRLAFGFR